MCMYAILLLVLTYKIITHKGPIIRVITKLPNSEQSYKGKVKTHKYINRQNQSTDICFTGFGTDLTTILPILFQYCYKYCYSENRNL
jgi:hypothetical protein